MNMTRIASDIKSFLSNQMNLIFIAVLLLGSINIYEGYWNYKAIIKCEKTINYRYFNLTTNLEDLNNVRIDTSDGTLRMYYSPYKI